MQHVETDIAESLHSYGFVSAGLPPAAGWPEAAFRCEPLDFPLSVVAPSSFVFEAVPPWSGSVLMPPATMRSWGQPTEASFAEMGVGAKVLRPGMPPPLCAAILRRPVDGPERSQAVRWAVLAFAFVGIATGTHFVLGGKHDAPAEAANQAPAASFEDFSGGLGRWEGAEAGSKRWNLDAARGATPLGFALFKPAKGITDYRLEFLAEIEKNGISWAIRATDPQNYQALQIIEKKSGKEKRMWLSRYSVKGGKEGPRTQVALQILVPIQPLWRVRLEATGDSCTMWIDDQIANAWSEASVPASSIGFFAGKGDQFVLKKVRITPQ